MPGGCCLVTPKQVAARGGRTKSCMSSRVVVVSIKPIIIANAYASLSATNSTFSKARVGWHYHGQGQGSGLGGSSLSRGCHCCCLVPACDRCNRRAARPDDTGQTKPQAALERTRDEDAAGERGVTPPTISKLSLLIVS